MQVNNTWYHTQKIKVGEFHQHWRMPCIIMCLLLLCMTSGFILKILFSYLVCCFGENKLLSCYPVILGNLGKSDCLLYHNSQIIQKLFFNTSDLINTFKRKVIYCGKMVRVGNCCNGKMSGGRLSSGKLSSGKLLW